MQDGVTGYICLLVAGVMLLITDAVAVPVGVFVLDGSVFILASGLVVAASLSIDTVTLSLVVALQFTVAG